ncbi:MAG: ATP-binding protein [Simkaniaceae bacterium]|nr:MAG: ATP-binding protein [Simkaniaceae bacterium]
MTVLTLSTALRSPNIEEGIKSWAERPIEDPLLELDYASKSFSGELPKNLKEQAEQLQREAQYFLLKTNPCSHEGYPILQKLFNLIISCLETAFDILGVEALLFKRDYEWQDENKSYKMMNLISFIGMLSTSILPLIGGDAARKKFAVGLTAIMGMSLIYPYFKPTPRALPRGLNLSEGIKNREVEVVEGEKRILDQMATAIRMQKKVLLVGPSGAGKTETAKAFVEAIEEGHYPELRKLTSFYYNTADIIDGSGWNLLSRIKALVGRNRERILFIWDEFHVVCKDHLADQMKTHFDPGPQGQPYAIAITTDEEIDAFRRGSHGALLRRFERIEISRCDDSRALRLLPSLLIRKMPEAIVLNPEEVFKYLIAQCQEKLPPDKFTPYQVHNALEVLNRCLELIGGSQLIATSPEALANQSEVQAHTSLRVAGAASSIFANRTDHDREINEKACGLSRQRTSLIEKEGEIKALFLKRQQLSAVKKLFYQTVLKIAQSQKPLRRDLVKFHLIGAYVERIIQEAVIQEGERLSVKTIIDQRLIDQAIEEIVRDRTPKG